MTIRLPVVIALLVLMLVGGVGVGIYLNNRGQASQAGAAEALADVRSTIIDMEMWRGDHGSYAGATTAKVRASEDFGLPSAVSVAYARRNAYCVEATVTGHTASYAGPAGPFRTTGC